MSLRLTAGLFVLLGLAASACGGDAGDDGLRVEGGGEGRRPAEEISSGLTTTAVPDPSPAPGSQPEPAPSPKPTAVPIASTDDLDIPTGEDYDPELNMYRYLSGGFHSAELSIRALAAAVENEDRSQVPVIIEGMRVMQPALAELSAVALNRLTGEDFGPGLSSWTAWMEWYGRNAADYPPPDGYLDWKVNLLSQIDPAFADFLMPWGLDAEINLTEVVWGGVRKDGIPDLRNAALMSAAEAEAAYILPDDRVFGVSINGEHRAYPLRIVNAHEMANDVLGGEPIALAY